MTWPYVAYTRGTLYTACISRGMHAFADIVVELWPLLQLPAVPAAAGGGRSAGRRAGDFENKTITAHKLGFGLSLAINIPSFGAFVL